MGLLLWPALLLGAAAYMIDYCPDLPYLGPIREAEPPVVRVLSQADDDGTETLFCQAKGFYPMDIDVTWRKDGEVMEHKTFHRDVGPNLDGTYHAWISIQVDPKDRDRYRCHVEHDSLLEPLDMALEESGAYYLGFIIVGVTIILLAAVSVGISLHRSNQAI
ncbi:major histocompatibility complex class I-related gene protein-like [Elgaria multicarinata webbii]|uniref:major histocompatibility complex class I-related gene protein-like n=1 Tax=Elgaria multicarinata webbii TaxID=159646 RepID=UPI002FCD0C26